MKSPPSEKHGTKKLPTYPHPTPDHPLITAALSLLLEKYPTIVIRKRKIDLTIAVTGYNIYPRFRNEKLKIKKSEGEGQSLGRADH